MAKTKAKTKGKPASKTKAGAKKKTLPAKNSAAKAKAPTKKAKLKPAKGKAAARPAVAKKKVPVAKKPIAKAKVKPPVKAIKKAALPKKATKTLPPKKVVPVVKFKPAPAKPMAKLIAAPVKKTAPAKVVALPSKPAAAPATKIVAEKPATKAPAKAKEAAEKIPVVAVMTGLEPLGAPARAAKKPMKERYVMEFYMNATPGSLYDLLCSPSGLSEWFCEDADVRGDQFTFRWGSDSQTAQCLSRKFGELMRFQWDADEDPGSYFELRIRQDPMTNETCLIVTDHAWPQDLEEGKALWESQIHTLQRMLGA